MADRAVECWRKAKQCAAIARAATDPDVQRIYNELVRQWREMAERVEQMERRLRLGAPRRTLKEAPALRLGVRNNRAPEPQGGDPILAFPTVPIGERTLARLAAA
jgi:hypothetical protein